jgi:hypothetical protein
MSSAGLVDAVHTYLYLRPLTVIGIVDCTN